MSAKYIKIFIGGVIQGVGFRPFIYRLAREMDLNGWVKNLGGRVEILVNRDKSEDFIQRIMDEAPNSSQIYDIETQIYDGNEVLKDFKILESQREKLGLQPLTKDRAICDVCLLEMEDKTNRHYGYAFTNCTDCGPRYSILKTLPYDRKNTSMSSFKMCSECQNEYKNPEDRRFHAQTNSCLKCAIDLKFYHQGELKGINEQAIEKCAIALKEGKIIALKGIGGFTLICNAMNDESIQRLRKKKHRPKKPFALMVRDIQMALKLVYLSNQEIEALTSSVAPIVLARKKNFMDTEKIAPNIETLGIVLPYSGLHHLLFQQIDFPIVFTSANISGEPIIKNFDELLKKLDGIFDGVLDYEREIVHFIDDSVVRLIAGEMRPIRLGRGLAPLDLNIDINSINVCVGMGAEQKSSLTYAYMDEYIVSPYIGDLDNPDTEKRYEEIFDFFGQIYSLKPDILARDLHNNHHSSIISAKKSTQIQCKEIKIQHHQAHFCAIFAEAILQGMDIKKENKVLGIIWDGSGLGDDGNIWGGEIFLGNLCSIERIGHFKPFGLIGGEEAIKKIYKIGYGLALECGANKIIESYEKIIPKKESMLLKMMFEKNINTIKTTSVGRLFDAVASICGLVQNNHYDGQTGMILEKLSKGSLTQECYDFKITQGTILYEKMILQLQEDILTKDFEKIAKKFINTLAKIVLDFALSYPGYCVVFSGGVFQNKALCEKILELFKPHNIRFYMHKLLPPNDTCISFGQAVYAQYHFRDKK
ncbi:carbamoyltransferase HypF [Helicobacter sp. 13S00477-4]|uniref:carbamoyltransferase HypF n=1 Tax=Helicobacter sp. 13S00477-4 TaxID=1905759 RepID=UPI0015DB1008|nr:carbamoyltransferase HypF [Helicobacter sp. 13S00477-4]